MSSLYTTEDYAHFWQSKNEVLNELGQTGNEMLLRALKLFEDLYAVDSARGLYLYRGMQHHYGREKVKNNDESNRVRETEEKKKTKTKKKAPLLPREARWMAELVSKKVSKNHKKWFCYVPGPDLKRLKDDTINGSEELQGILQDCSGPPGVVNDINNVLVTGFSNNWAGFLFLPSVKDREVVLFVDDGQFATFCLWGEHKRMIEGALSGTAAPKPTLNAILKQRKADVAALTGFDVISLRKPMDAAYAHVDVQMRLLPKKTSIDDKHPFLSIRHESEWKAKNAVLTHTWRRTDWCPWWEVDCAKPWRITSKLVAPPQPSLPPPPSEIDSGGGEAMDIDEPAASPLAADDFPLTPYVNVEALVAAADDNEAAPEFFDTLFSDEFILPSDFVLPPDMHDMFRTPLPPLSPAWIDPVPDLKQEQLKVLQRKFSIILGNAASKATDRAIFNFSTHPALADLHPRTIEDVDKIMMYTPIIPPDPERIVRFVRAVEKLTTWQAYVRLVGHALPVAPEKMDSLCEKCRRLPLLLNETFMCLPCQAKQKLPRTPVDLKRFQAVLGTIAYNKLGFIDIRDEALVEHERKLMGILQ